MAGLISGRVTIRASLLALVLCCVATYCAGMETGSESRGVITGGAAEIPVDSPEVKELSKLLLDKLSEGDNKDVQLVKVTKASRQVVSGTLTHLTFIVNDGGENHTYEASIWEQPWLNKTEITKLKLVGEDA